MGLFDSILGGTAGKTDGSSGAAPVIMGILGTLLARNGGWQGLAIQFLQSGQGKAFSSWVATGENQPISGDQIQQVLGSEQVNALAAKFGINSTQISQFLAEFLPKAVDQLTPKGKLDPSADNQQSLDSLIPTLLQSLGGKPPGG